MLWCMLLANKLNRLKAINKKDAFDLYNGAEQYLPCSGG